MELVEVGLVELGRGLTERLGLIELAKIRLTQPLQLCCGLAALGITGGGGYYLRNIKPQNLSC